MKRILTFVVLAFVITLCGIPCFAESAEHSVYAKYVESDANCGRGIVKDGKASVVLPDGIIVTVSGIRSDAYALYVKEFTDNDPSAIEWFSQLLSNQSKGFYPFDICLLDESGRVVVTNNVDVQIVFPNTYADQVFFVDTNSNVLEQNCNYEKNMISFQSKLNAYCLIIPAENQPSFFKIGDANRDNSVDMKDVLVVRKFIANMAVTIDESAADVNRDNSVDMKDVLLIRKFIAKMIEHF